MTRTAGALFLTSGKTMNALTARLPCFTVTYSWWRGERSTRCRSAFGADLAAAMDTAAMVSIRASFIALPPSRTQRAPRSLHQFIVRIPGAAEDEATCGQ